MDGLTAGGGPAWAVAARARWRGSREAAGRVRPAVRPPSDAGPARRLRYAAAGAAGPSPLAVWFFFPHPGRPLRQGPSRSVVVLPEPGRGQLISRC